MKIHVCGREYLCEDFGQNFRWTLTGEEKEGVTTLSLALDFKEKLRPKKTALSFFLPALGADGCWSACGGVNRVLTPDWGPFTVNSRSVAGIPVLSILSEDDVNVLTASLSDAETPCALKAGYREEDSLLAVTLEWFLDVTESMTGYRAQIVIDERRLPFYECVKEAPTGFEKIRRRERAARGARTRVFHLVLFSPKSRIRTNFERVQSGEGFGIGNGDCRRRLAYDG